MRRNYHWSRWLRPSASGAELALLLALVSLPASPGLAAAAAAPGDSAVLSLSPPSGRLIGPGSGLELVWTITNHTDVARTAALELTTSRTWPLSRTIHWIEAPPNESTHFLVPSSVPDTAAAGEVWVFARLRLEGDATALDSCASELLVRNAPPAAVPVVVVSDLVRLEWRAWLRWRDTGIVEVSRDGQAWHPEGGVTADEQGRCVFEDRSVTPGSTVSYRLRATAYGLTMVSAVTTAQVPERTPLAIAGLRPNPSRGAPVVAFTLPERATTRLDVYDLAGRRVWASELGELAPGPHVLAIAPHAELRSGVYVFRLTSAARSVSVRGVIAR